MQPAPLPATRALQTASTGAEHALRHPIARAGTALLATVGGPARLRVVLMLAAVLALSSADSATIGTIAAPLERGLHIDNTQLGLLVTASTAIAAFATLPMGALTDRVNRTRLLFVAVLIWSAMMVLNGLSVSFGMLLITRLGLGVAVAVGGPVVASLTGDWFPAEERARVYGYVLSGELVGTGIGFVLSGDIAQALSWRWSFFALAVLGGVLALFVHRMPEPQRGGGSRLPAGAGDLDASGGRDASDGGDREDGAGEDDGAGGVDLGRQLERVGVRPGRRRHGLRDDRPTSLRWALRYVLSIPTNNVLIAASALGYFFYAGLETFGVLFLRARFGLQEATASMTLVVLGAGALAGALVAGRLADRLIRHRHVTARPVVAGAAFLLAAAMFAPGLLAPSLLVAGPLLALGAAGLGGSNPPLDAARLDLIDDSLWGRAEAVRTVLRSGLQAAGPLVFGYLSTRFGAHTSGFGAPTGSGGAGGVALMHTFLTMLGPLLLAGALILLLARRTYPRDVATTLREHADVSG